MNMDTDKILVIDINYLPSEFREGTISDTKKRLEEDYKMKVLLIDSSKQNIQGATGLRPIYTI